MSDASLPHDAAQFLNACVGEGWTAQPLLGDASTRQYFRVHLSGGQTRILAYYSPELREQLQRYMAAYRALAPHVPVAEVLCDSQSCILQTDVGNETLFDLLHHDRDEGVRRYRDAIDRLDAFQRASGTAINPPFDAAFFFAEMEMTREFYVEKLMGVPHAESERLAPMFRKLAENVARHPYVLCHRDYHGQNIHLYNDDLYLLDYQDMRMGPDTYDLASLLRDRGVAALLGDAEMELARRYAAKREGGTDAALHRYFETLLQRSIKILGTFARQPIDRGRLHYLEFIPATLDSVARCLRELPEFAELARGFPMSFSLQRSRERLKGTSDGQAQDHAPSR